MRKNEEIILGLNICNRDRDEIISIANKKNIPIFKIQKKHRAFLLEKVSINMKDMPT
jgi:hypothetical protein